MPRRYYLLDQINEEDVELRSDVARLEGGQIIRHSWQRDGWVPFQGHILTDDDGQLYTASVAGNRGRVTGTEASNANHRVLYLHEDTNWADSEVFSVWWGPSAYTTAGTRPQMGHVHRMQVDADGHLNGYAVWFDIVIGAPQVLNMNPVATVDGINLLQGAGAQRSPSAAQIERRLTARYAARLDAFDAAQYRVLPLPGPSVDMYGLANGDLVTITGMGDTSFNRANVAAGNVATNFFQLVDTVANNNVDNAAGGIITFDNAVKRYFPYCVRSQMVGTTIRVKQWRYSEPEPDWGDTNCVTEGTVATDGDFPTLATGPGYCGLWAAHAHDNLYMEWGDVTFRQVLTQIGS